LGLYSENYYLLIDAAAGVHLDKSDNKLLDANVEKTYNIYILYTIGIWYIILYIYRLSHSKYIYDRIILHINIEYNNITVI